MAASNIGPAQIYLGQDPPTIVFYSDGTTAHISGYVQPVVESYSIAPFGEHRELTGASGEVTSTRTTRTGLECTLTFRPEGTDEPNAIKAAAVPAIGMTAAISGMKTIQVGLFANAWNVAQGANTMWHVTAVSPLTGGPQDPQTYSVTMRRYTGLSGNVVVAD